MATDDVEWYASEISACRRDIAELSLEIDRLKAKRKSIESDLELAFIGLDTAQRQREQALELLQETKDEQEKNCG